MDSKRLPKNITTPKSGNNSNTTTGTGSSSSSSSSNSNNNNKTKSSGIAIGVRFNAGEEIIEDILQPLSSELQQPHLLQNQSLSNSPLQNIEDFNWRKEILHGGFFNRKRSGSIEGNKTGGLLSNSVSSSVITSTINQINNSSIGSAGILNNDNNTGTASSSSSISISSTNLIGNLSTTTTAATTTTTTTATTDNSGSVGTWKLIKGKVSQAMEDIKSSKNSSQSQSQNIIQNDDSDFIGIKFDSNLENIINNDLISSTTTTATITTTTATAALPIGYNLPSLKPQHKYFSFSRRSNKSDTDSDDENEISVVEDFIESKSLRKSFANLKTKAKTHLSGTSSIVSSSSSGKKESLINDSLTTTTTTTTSAVTAATTSAAAVTTSSITNTVPITTSSSSTSLSLGSGIRSTFLRKRNKKQSPDKISPPSSTLTTIESGVEMFEDMELIQNLNNSKLLNRNLNTTDTDLVTTPADDSNTAQQEGLKISLSTDTITFKKPKNSLNSTLYHQQTVPNLFNSSNTKNTAASSRTSLRFATTGGGVGGKISNSNEKYNAKNIIEFLQTIVIKNLINSNCLIAGILLTLLLMAPIAEFFRGIIACLLIITLFNTFSEHFWNALNEKIKIICTNYFGGGCGGVDGDGNDSNNHKSNNLYGPQYCKFAIPDYNRMSTCEIPVIEEHKSLKVYSGWMNEINNYDPINFHQSMTRSVYIRLDGSILRILNTSTRIPKRSMWNENSIDRKNIIFTCSRTFNLIGARIEMLPRGLARKRYFSRKYPLQLIIKNHENLKTFLDNESTNLLNIDNDSGCNDTINNKSDKSDNKILIEENHNINISTGSKISTTIGSTATAATSSSPSPSSDNNNLNSNNVIHQNSNEELRNLIDNNQLNDLDFGATLLNSDLQKLQDTQDPIALKETIPCGDETRILLFARCDREKEDWYRRFYSASIGAIHDQDLKMPDIVMITDEEVSQAIKLTTNSTEFSNINENSEILKNEKDDKQQQQLPIQNSSNNILNLTNNNSSCSNDNNDKRNSVPIEEASVFEGLLFSADAGRNPPEYIKFMARYQKACNQNKIPVFKSSLVPNETPTRRNRRQKRQEDELWKGINQSLYLGPSGSIVWANVLIGRILFSCLNDTILLEKIQDFLQRKLSAIRLPSFMEDVSIAHINLGDTPPLIHRISQPQLDERGTWIDADVTYEGLVHMTITTKLNLLRLKRSQHGGRDGGSNNSTGGGGGGGGGGNQQNNSSGNSTTTTTTTNQNISATITTTPVSSLISRPSSSSTSSLSSSSAAIGDKLNPTDRINLNRSTGNSGGGSITPTTSIENVVVGTTTSDNVTIATNAGTLSTSSFTPLSSTITDTTGLTSASTATITTASITQSSNIDNITQDNENSGFINLNSDYNSQNSLILNSAIYDSNAESSGASSSESDSPTTGSVIDISSESQPYHPAPGSSRRFLRIVDRITASNIFQSATEISYIQRAMENMSTKITLRVELKGLVSRIVFNIPPPPSDRVWLAFRGPPRLWISAKPAVGDHAFDWSVVTNVIENKLCDEVYKYLVYPNMVDVIVPFLGQSTYKE